MKTDFKNVPVLVTGGAGFIGSHLARKLSSLKADVHVYDDFSSGKIYNTSDIADQIEIITGDIRDYQTLKSSIQNVEYVFHLAANASVPISVENPTYDFETNALGTFNVLRSVLELDSNKTVVCASSAAVYGEPQTIPIPEGHPLNPASPYGVSKLVGELYCRMFAKTYNIPVVSIRYFNVYGPAQPRYVMYDFLQKLVKNSERLEVLGNGEQVRDFTYISDAVDATLLIAKSLAEGKLRYRTVNLGTTLGTRINELAELILEILGYDAEIKYTGRSWKGDIPTMVADTERLRGLGYTHKIDLAEGCKKFVDWFMSQHSIREQSSK